MRQWREASFRHQQFGEKRKIAIDKLIGMVPKSIIEDTIRKFLSEPELAKPPIA